MKLGNDKDKFGYYQVGDFKTYSKVEAIELQRRTGIYPQWNFNEAEFSSYDWTVEPTETLGELYTRRARQLRETYDYIVLFYSGGSDSSNIVETFVNNQIEFDEIATYDYWSIDPDRENFFHKEQFQVSYPYIQLLQEQGIQFKHRRIDLGSVSVGLLQDQQYATNRAYYGNSHWGTNHLSRGYIRDIIPDYQRLADQGKKVVFVWGCDKPRLFYENNRYCMKFIDFIGSSGVTVRTQLLNRENEYDELFYWAPESADIICKQSHTLMKFFKQHQITNMDVDKKINGIPAIEQIFQATGTFDGLSYRNVINWLIYSQEINNTFSLGKRPGVIWNPRDLLLHNNPQYNHHILNMVDHLQQLDPQWINNPNDINQGLVGCVSPSYYLEKDVPTH